MTRAFRFKQFSIEQDLCAMKIGTDAVLLGAWTPITHFPKTILDIGAGTGVLALMLAQRTAHEKTSIEIDAVEIQADAYEQCVTNFENSAWNDRLFCFHASLEDYVKELETTYDLIVSNPPYFSSSTNTKDTSAREIARFNSSLPFKSLLEGVSKSLSEHGVFSVILPEKETANFIALASNYRLFPNAILQVRGTTESPIKRSCIAFSYTKTAIKENELIIEHSRHHYTEDYVNLTKDFYLKL